ncbi:MAG: aspartate--tRNA ligase [Clostridiales bacterium]|jgi:aspartyl-tRNA synthetase|nr:aspartate--tRNA ligase [Clostridiales bacterium]
MCGEVGAESVGREVVVMGWVGRRRDLGRLIFITVRDRSGLVQAVVNGDEAAPELFARAESLRGEYVVAVTGTVSRRADKDVNTSMKTGEVEIIVSDLVILNEAETPPFSVADEGVRDDTRLKYRYIDLRREDRMRNLILRDRAVRSARNFLAAEGFLEIETPILANTSPEGARDYLVPSRVHPGAFYALPQSPQVFKQLLMVAGADRYYQIARCFRDEDLRADRQPEFTQIDMELSFVGEEDIIALNERMMRTIFMETLGYEIPLPIPRLTYREAMDRFGSDKPDLRFGMELVDITDSVRGTGFAVFRSAIDAGGTVRGIRAPGCADLPRKRIDALALFVRDYRAKGLAWITITPSGEVKSAIAKFFTPEELGEIIKKFGAEPGDIIFICADKYSVVTNALGALRQEIARGRGMIRPGDYRFVWITEFPLLEWSEEDARFYATHHPFTAPMDEDIPFLGSDPGRVRAKAYDLALNGFELGGGSVRIHRADIQRRMFEILGITPERAEEAFGHLLTAFRYGAPPHGGLAFGLDRLVMLIAGAEAIRDVIAFPKVKDASCPLTNAPAAADPAQLAELCVEIRRKESDPE